MADPLYRVELTASFLQRLEPFEAFLGEAGRGLRIRQAAGRIALHGHPNLRRFPRIGRRYLDQPPQSTEALAQLAALPPREADALREYLHGDYLILYTLDAKGKVVYLLSVRHHRELSFQFAGLWPGASVARER